MARSIIRILLTIVALGLILFILIQFVPYGRNHNNPPVVKEPRWVNPETRLLAKRACFDCHSNETTWPWYSNVAPVSWLVQKDVEEARSFLNFSEWQGAEADEIGEVIYNGIMPPPQYMPMHPEAKLSDAEKKTLVEGLTQTIQQP
jgi:cytochrome c551/c552